ncbi:MAG: helix-turn-helix transcriptional regulator [Oscillospiraceae bacterium]|nr:helix-turn-helix transcriptional regulator [Oscillospiraceae bacterium]
MIYSGFIIKKERLERNWSQEGLCKGICTVSYLSKIEQGKTEASEDIISALFKRLGIDWVMDKEILSEGEKFIEEWYDSVFSDDYKKIVSCNEKFEKEFSCLKNSPFAIDIFLLKKFTEDETFPLDERLESSMDSRQLSLQRLLGGRFSEAEKLNPCALMYLRSGYADYEKGDNFSALENLQKAYILASEEGRLKIMLFAKLFITNCYSNIGDLDSMEYHGRIAKRIALDLGETEFAETVDYNYFATKIEVGDYSGAYSYFSKLSEPSAPSLHKLAVCCEKLGKKEEAFAALEKEKTSAAEGEKAKFFADKACELIKFRLEHEDYLSDSYYGKLLLDFFDSCRKEMPAGYAKFHLPWVVEWLTANRQYKQAFELLSDFLEK